MNCVYFILVVFILVQNVWTEPIYYGKISGKTKEIRVNGQRKLISINNGEFPFLVGLVRKETDYLFCGSALISTRVLVSAAHCFIKKKAEEVKARFGSFMRSGDGDHVKFREILEFIPHKQFECDAPEPREFDIALIVLKKSINQNKYIKTIPLTNIATRNEFNRRKVFILGWGYMEKHKASFHLREAAPFLLSREDCQSLMYRQAKLTKNMICTIGGFAGDTEKPGLGSGDSGGPVVLFKNGRYELVGVVSFSTTIPNKQKIVMTDTNYPAVHTDVAELKDWINAKLDYAEELVKSVKPKKVSKKKSCFPSK